MLHARQDALDYTMRSMGKTIEGQYGCGMPKVDACTEKIDYGLSKY